ncbi:MAG: chloride channel protein, partial [Alphaproteobacteria bacterium]|nr:chloride channel protein [Alphaproteobacteria bacterium]
LDTQSYLLFGLMGILAAALAIAAMTSVTWSERLLRQAKVPDWMRPAIGGLVLSGIALYFPQVLGSGHGAIQYHFEIGWALVPLLALLAAKLIAAAVSVGSGFRGGLFSSSLFLGCLFGAAFAAAVTLLMAELARERTAFMLVGMGSVAAAIVGAPLTMVFLVLEATGDFPVTVGVVVGVVVASTIVRLTFGFSFSTWRFHQRGLGIRGAHDIGWITDLTVNRLMRSDPKVVAGDMSVDMLRRRYPPGSVKRVYVTDGDGKYAGSLDMAKVHDPALDNEARTATVEALATAPDIFLLPGENVRAALTRFEQSETESLPVLSSRSEREIVGYMTEAYGLRRYTQELERRRSAELGERDLFSIGPLPKG